MRLTIITKGVKANAVMNGNSPVQAIIAKPNVTFGCSAHH